MSEVNGDAPAEVAPERRESPRYLIKQPCLVRPAELGATRPDYWHCIAFDISTHGIGATLPLPLVAGAELIIEAFDSPGATPLHVGVTRAVPVEFTWFAGCTLVEPLTPEQLRFWLRNRP